MKTALAALGALLALGWAGSICAQGTPTAPQVPRAAALGQPVPPAAQASTPRTAPPARLAPAAQDEESDILIFRPLDHNARVLDPEELLHVPGGMAFLVQRNGELRVRGGAMYRFQVTVSALSPLQRVTINGTAYPVPRRSSAEVDALVLLDPGSNEVVVTAATASAEARKVFTITLNSLRVPGFPLYVAVPVR
ncbi:MAG: hypothetical protein HY342_04850 [Candidatus Lambdaproteobacteria bacterium]|nr:hypothetical protein [Candidatus Lambdaproteobacteria bacterium]